MGQAENNSTRMNHKIWIFGKSFQNDYSTIHVNEANNIQVAQHRF